MPPGITNVFRLAAVSSGMAVAISCAGMLAAMFLHGGTGGVLPALGLAAVIMVVIALVFVSYAQRFPGAVPVRASVMEAFGHFPSSAVTLIYVSMMVLIGGYELYLCNVALSYVMPPLLAGSVLAVVTASVIVVNLQGQIASLRVQVITTVLVVSMLIAISLAGWSDRTTPEIAEVEKWWLAVPMGIFLFVGVEWASLYVTGPAQLRRQLPAAMLLSIATLALVYGSLSWALGSTLTMDRINGAPLPHMELVTMKGAPGTKLVVVAVSVLALITSLNVGLYGAARITSMLARDAGLPGWFGRINPATGTPVNALTAVVVGVFLVLPWMWMDAARQAVSYVLGINLCIVYGAVLASWLRTASRTGGFYIRALMVGAALSIIVTTGIASMVESVGTYTPVLLAAQVFLIGLLIRAGSAQPRTSADNEVA